MRPYVMLFKRLQPHINGRQIGANYYFSAVNYILLALLPYKSRSYPFIAAVNWELLKKKRKSTSLVKIRKYIPVSRAELITGMISFISFMILVGGARLARLANTHSIESDKPVSIYLQEKTDLSELSELMADSGLIESREELIWAGRLLGWNKFNAGHYEIDGSYSYDVLLSRMARGIQDPISLTILPGVDKKRLIASIASKFSFDTTTLSGVFTDSSFLAENGIGENQLLGRMLPNTYSIYWTSKPEAVVKKILSEFESQILEEYRARFEQLDRTVNEIITLASIIEWEAYHEEEKAKISGLYWNRLEEGMRLQADPTINYVVGERRRLLYTDYQIEHPYNTYLNRGLPPGPITNPSRSSIEAALFPQNHDFLYMVANPEGYHIFSETFEEHKRESAKWRDWIREQYRIKHRNEQQSEDVSS